MKIEFPIYLEISLALLGSTVLPFLYSASQLIFCKIKNRFWKEFLLILKLPNVRGGGTPFWTLCIILFMFKRSSGSPITARVSTI